MINDERDDDDAVADSSSDHPAHLLYTPAEAAALLTVRESWLRRRAGLRLIPCTFLGKHLRFSARDLTQIAEAGSRPARTTSNWRRRP